MYDNNPIPITTKLDNPLTSIHCNPDPYMIYHEGVYYCYSTGYHGVNVLRSDNFNSFEHMGFALKDDSQKAYWAPAVIFYNGLFYMYYSSVLNGETDPHREFLKVAVADNPLGPFTWKRTLFDEFTIDAHVVEKNGELYLFYSPNITEGEKIGTIIALDKLIDPFTPLGKPRIIVYPTIEQEIHIRNRSGYNRDWYTIEGAFYFEYGGTGFLMYSANAFEHEDYFVGYCTCDSSVPLDEAVFQKYPDDKTYNPLIGKDNFVTGCGHNSIITGPNKELFIVYHGRSRVEAHKPGGLDDGRRLCVSEIKVKGKELILARRK